MVDWTICKGAQGSQHGFAQNFSELLVYKKSRKLSFDIFLLTKEFPKSETYALIDQIRRCSRSVGAHIAEAWSNRRYEKMFVSKLSIADGELHETIHWIEIAQDCGYLDPQTAGNLRGQSLEIGKILGGMIQNPEKYCRVFSMAVHDGDEKS